MAQGRLLVLDDDATVGQMLLMAAQPQALRPAAARICRLSSPTCNPAHRRTWWWT
jgi:hypothetical protein